MLILPEDVKQLTLYFQRSANLDEELASRCLEPLEDGRYDDAVRLAFLVLEKRLREVTGLERGTGADLANRAFNNDSDLVKRLGLDSDPGMTSGLRQLYAGAFSVFRNPAAHRIDISYTPAQTREIISLVNLLLRQLNVVDSPEIPLKRLFSNRKIPLTIQAWYRELITDLVVLISDLKQNVGEKYIGLHSHEKAFASIGLKKTQIEIVCFTRGRALMGTKVLNPKSSPRWGKARIKSKSQISQGVEILKESQSRLVAAIEAGEPTGYFSGGSKKGSPDDEKNDDMDESLILDSTS
ncbi:MAG TPA: TIGR02391 family protein [Anaerolineae bacterium]|nr:TIGR02391 family protein [Anaerolineae bacterium]